MRTFANEAALLAPRVRSCRLLDLYRSMRDEIVNARVMASESPEFPALTSTSSSKKD